MYHPPPISHLSHHTVTDPRSRGVPQFPSGVLFSRGSSACAGVPDLLGRRLLGHKRGSEEQWGTTGGALVSKGRGDAYEPLRVSPVLRSLSTRTACSHHQCCGSIPILEEARSEGEIISVLPVHFPSELQFALFVTSTYGWSGDLECMRYALRVHAWY